MYAFIWKNGHTIWKERWSTLMSRASLWVDLYMTCEDQVFVANVTFINPTREMMALSVISWLTCVVVELNDIAKICKYKGVQEGHLFIPMAMEVHNTFGRDMDHFISLGNVFVFSTTNNQEIIYPCFFTFKFLGNMLVSLSNVL